MQHTTFREGRRFVGLVPFEADLLMYLNEFAQKQGIRQGRVTAIGAVSKAAVAIYDQSKQDYYQVKFPHQLEILNLSGNISILKGEPFVHAHVTFADGEGRAFGGHLAEGTKVFSCEFTLIEILPERELVRELDFETGLNLWRF